MTRTGAVVEEVYQVLKRILAGFVPEVVKFMAAGFVPGVAKYLAAGFVPERKSLQRRQQTYCSR